MTGENGASPTLVTRAFGLDIDSDFAMPGIDPSPPVGDGRSLRLLRATEDEVREGFPEGADRIAELRFDDGHPMVYIDSAGEDGYLTYAFDFGHARISPDGRHVRIAQFDEPDWVWQRYLTGQILPFCALLQGFEVFHACVLGVDGRAVAVVANSGVGKTTLALNLALRGLSFMSDDVLVAEAHADGVLAHPGIGLANVRPSSRGLLPALTGADLARPIGERERETRIAIRRGSEALPLAMLFVLNRFDQPRPLTVEQLAPVDPRVLLASSFNFSLRTPDRLRRQLDVCGRIEGSVPVFRVSSGGGVDAETVAEGVLEQARTTLAC